MGADLIFAGDLNVDLDRTGRRWLDEDIAVAVTMVGLEEISAHFLPWQRAYNLYQRPWAVMKQGRLMRTLMDYILGYDCQIFQNVTIQDPRHNSSPLHGHGVSAFRLPEGSVIIPRAQDTPPSFSGRTWDKDTGKQYFCVVYARCPEAKQTDGASQLVDFQVDVKTHAWLVTCHPCDLTLPFSSIHQQPY